MYNIDSVYVCKNMAFTTVFNFIFRRTLGEWGSVIPTVIETNFGDSVSNGTIRGILTDRKFVVIAGSLMALPGCFSRTFSTLSWSSIFTMSTIVITIAWSFYILIRYIDNPDESNGMNVMKIRPLWWTTEVILCFCLTFQQKLFFVFNCLRRRSLKRFAPAVQCSHLFVAALYITFGGVCAIHFSDVDNFQDFNYFNDYKQTSESRAVFDVTRTTVLLSLLFTIPVESLVIVTVWRRLRRRYIKYKKSLMYIRGTCEYNPVNGDDDDDDCYDKTYQLAARQNDQFCCLQLQEYIFGNGTLEGEEEDKCDKCDDITPAKRVVADCNPDARKNTVSTACTMTNESFDQALPRANTFDPSVLATASASASYKSNTTDDNMKSVSSAISDASGCSPARRPRQVSFQDEKTPTRPPFPSNNYNTKDSPCNQSTNVNNTSIHLAADSPNLFAQDGYFFSSAPDEHKSLTTDEMDDGSIANLNDSASLVSCLGSSIFGDDSRGNDHEEVVLLSLCKLCDTQDTDMFLCVVSCSFKKGGVLLASSKN